MARSRTIKDAVIPNGGTDTPTVTVPTNSTLLGIHLPASMTGTTLKFKALATASAAATLIKKADNTDYSLTIGSAAAFIPVDPNMFEGVEFLQVISGSAEGAARTLKLAFGQTS